MEPNVAAAVGKVAINTAMNAAVIAHKQGWLDQLIDFFKRKHFILLLGSTGVGKSSVLKSLINETMDALIRSPSTSDIDRQSIRINKEPVIIYDTPGQDCHESKREEIIRDVLADRIKLSGIINVVAYGYHERLGVLDGALKISSNGRIKENSLDEYLKKHRQLEIEFLLKEMSSLSSQNAKWLITLVNKADMWWDTQYPVLQYYTSTSEPYYQSLHTLPKLKNINSMVLPYCSVIHKFYDKTKVSGNFDDTTKVKLKTDLLHQLVILCK